jgi:phosphomannomutase
MPGATIIGDVKCSKVFFDKVKEYGGDAHMLPTGASVMKKRIPTLKNVALAGEVSGHFIFVNGYYGYDDGIYAGVKFLNAISNRNETVSDIIADFPQTWITHETRIKVPEEDKFNLVEKIAQIIKQNPKYPEVVEIDGVRASNEHQIIGIRASNTENLLSIRCESLASRKDLEDALEYLIENLNNLGVDISMKDFEISE